MSSDKVVNPEYRINQSISSHFDQGSQMLFMYFWQGASARLSRIRSSEVA